MNRAFLTRYAWMSIAAAIVTLGLKTGAYLVTGSVGLLSDAVESIVNLLGGLVALTMLTIATRPPDESHPFGHSKAEYFSSIIEGVLIGCASVSIGVTAVMRLLNPVPLEDLGLGLIISTGASLVNLAVALVLRSAGKKHQSIALVASSQHLMTDVWTSAGVIVGIGAVALTGFEPLDPLVAIAVAINILWAAFRIIRKSVTGLMDGAAPEDVRVHLQALISTYHDRGVDIHEVLTREFGAASYISLHFAVPGSWSVEEGHQMATDFEEVLKERVPNAIVHTHIEPIEDGR
jgi:cation diffusion facilitator family transporter